MERNDLMELGKDVLRYGARAGAYQPFHSVSAGANYWYFSDQKRLGQGSDGAYLKHYVFHFFKNVHQDTVLCNTNSLL